MEREIRFAKNTGIIFIGKISTQLINFCLLPLYTSKLNPNDYGKADLIHTYASIMTVLLFIQIEQALFRFLIDSRSEKSEEKTIISTILLYSFSIDLILLLVGVFVKSISVISDYCNLFFMIISLHFLENMLQLARGEGDNITYTITNFLNSILMIFFNIVFLLGLHKKSDALLLSIILSNLCSSGYLFMKKRIYRKIHIKYFDCQKWKEIAAYCLPLVPNAISWWVVSASDRIILSVFLGTGAVGLVAVSQKFSNMIFNIYSIVNITWNEYVSVNIKDYKEIKFFEVGRIILSSFFSLCMGTITMIPMAFRFLINQKYSEAYHYMPIYIIGVLFNITVNLLNAFFVAFKRTNDIAKTSVAAAVINLTGNLLFVRHFGIYAVACSTALAFLAVLLWRKVYLKRYMDWKWKYSELLIYLSQSMITLLFYYKKAGWPFCLLNMLTIVAVWYWLNKRYVSISWKAVRRWMTK